MLFSYLALTREGHLDEVLHVFAYLKKHMNSEIDFDLKNPEVDMDIFQWKPIVGVPIVALPIV